MNYYRRFIGDYGRDTRHLSLTQHGAFALLLDYTYATEKPLPASIESLARICSAMSEIEVAAVKAVAEEFFPIGEDGLRHNSRADREIADTDAYRELQSRKGKLGGRPPKQRAEKPEESRDKAEAFPTARPGESRSFSPVKPEPKPEESREKALHLSTPTPIYPDATATAITNGKHSPSLRSGAPVADAPQAAEEGAVGRVFEHWKTEHQHSRAVLDEKRRKLLRDRLKVYSEADLCQAISGYRASPHHMGQNLNGVIYDDIELMLRDAKHVDAGIKLYREPPRADLSLQSRRIVSQTENWQPPEVRRVTG